MNLRDRIEGAMSRAGFDSQQSIADACGVTQPAVFALLSGQRPMLDLLKKIAEKTSVDYDWLRFGDEMKAPHWALTLRLDAETKKLIEGIRARVSEPGATYHSAGPNSPLRVVGTVVAGDGDISQLVVREEAPINFPEGWEVVRVEGMSAYPVIYPGQLAIIDTGRATSPATWTDANRIDLHDNLVLIQTDGDSPRAYLKRFCRDLEAPGGYVLASVDGGRSSPYIAPDKILVIAPVVGVMFLDPREPRKKSWHQKTVVVSVDQ